MKKILFSIILILSILNIGLFTICNAATEYDVNYVANFLNNIGVLNGYPDGDLKLNNNITREEFSKLIVLVSNFKNTVDLTSKSSVFKDVEKTRWSAPYIKVAVKNSILQGYPDLTFRPTNNINLEEASVIALRLLQYTSNDYGTAWPYSQVTYAKEKGILEGINKNIGEDITRQDAINIIFNTLCSKVNGTTYTYMNVLEYDIAEDIIIISTNKEDKTLEANQIYTSAGIFKCVNEIKGDIIGTKATLVFNSDKEVVSVVPQKQNVEKYSIISAINNGVIVNNNGTEEFIKIDNNTIVYYKMQKLTLSNIIANKGNSIYINKDKNRNANFAVLVDSEYIGPTVVTNKNILNQYSNTVVIKNNERVTTENININDVIYYYPSTNELLVVDNKATGMIEQILPNKYNVSSIVIAGKEYRIETEKAYTNIKQYNEGEVVTILLGKDNKIVDILNSKDLSVEQIGLLIDSGAEIKTSSNGNQYSSYYVTIITADGNTTKITVDEVYDDYINEVVKIAYSSNKAVVRRLGIKKDVYGIVNSTKKTIGNTKLASDINIIEIPKVNNEYISVTKKISLSRLNGVSIGVNSVINYTKNDNGEIDNLIITEVTSDMYTPVIVLEELAISPFASDTMYKYNLNGIEYTLMTDNINFNIGNNKPAMMLIQNGKIVDINKMIKVSGEFSEESSLKLISNNKEYILESDTVVYTKVDNEKYTSTNLDEILRTKDITNITGYMDKEQNVGGKIRLLVIE